MILVIMTEVIWNKPQSNSNIWYIFNYSID